MRLWQVTEILEGQLSPMRARAVWHMSCCCQKCVIAWLVRQESAEGTAANSEAEVAKLQREAADAQTQLQDQLQAANKLDVELADERGAHLGLKLRLSGQMQVTGAGH